jgi:hypothetical protein
VTPKKSAKSGHNLHSAQHLRTRFRLKGHEISERVVTRIVYRILKSERSLYHLNHSYKQSDDLWSVLSDISGAVCLDNTFTSDYTRSYQDATLRQAQVWQWCHHSGMSNTVAGIVLYRTACTLQSTSGLLDRYRAYYVLHVSYCDRYVACYVLHVA